MIEVLGVKDMYKQMQVKHQSSKQVCSPSLTKFSFILLSVKCLQAFNHVCPVRQVVLSPCLLCVNLRSLF